jgi:hypothetical protein
LTKGFIKLSVASGPGLKGLCMLVMVLESDASGKIPSIGEFANATTVNVIAML